MRTEFSDLPLEEALELARIVSQREGLVLYLEIEITGSYIRREIVWHPDRWEPHEG